mgnify:CR=1
MIAGWIGDYLLKIAVVKGLITVLSGENGTEMLAKVILKMRLLIEIYKRLIQFQESSFLCAFQLILTLYSRFA